MSPLAVLEAGIDSSEVGRYMGLVPTSRGIEPPPANGSVGTKVVDIARQSHPSIER
jgi:hypothetical protein